MTLLLNVEEESAPQAFIPGGPLYTLSSYYGNNILEIIFGKGLTYSFMQDDLISNSPLGAFLYLNFRFLYFNFF